MSGTALAAGVVTAQRAAGAADAAALAAADVASGAIRAEVDACASAALVARAAGSELGVCDLDGLTATVEVRSAYSGLVAVARARAGPPNR
ncbi:helicase [Microbacterium esteraromaticum]|uniref:helicase n=1 Tax=Microbacterium esteraromaticum TaxID=57043 RepID=UPI00195B16C1|nr:helicase [Microbacterium esteraromaticum]MBM7465304.1 phage-related tail protein [Microbacterium esteraromaticum]